MEIRLASVNDAAGVLEVYGPVCRTPVSFEEGPPTLDEMSRRIAATLERFPWLTCEESGRLLGYAYASAHRQRAAYRWSIDVSVYVRDGCRRRGIGRGLYVALLAVARLQGFRNAYAGIALPNDASVGLHETIGFRPVGVYRNVGYKCGAWRDVGWWQLALQEHTAEPAEPRAYSLVRGSTEWAAAIQAGAACLKPQTGKGTDTGSCGRPGNV